MIRNLRSVLRLIQSDWRQKRVLVLGDLMVDRYIWGQVERISPEAPVPVVRAVDQNERPGGAANVAMNIAGLGARATLFGFCGEDSDGAVLEKCLAEGGVDVRVTRVAGYPTTTKLRILSGKQQILRLDAERVDGYPASSFEKLVAAAQDRLNESDALVLSDYAKGVLTAEVCKVMIATARSRRIPVLVDPKQPNLERYRGATTICPNQGDLSLATGIATWKFRDLLRAGQKLAAELKIEYLTATLGEKGIAVLRPERQFIASACARQVFDVSGAGDTVIATLALALASGMHIEAAVHLANIAAGIVVGKVGTVPVTRNELLASLTRGIGLKAQEKVLSLDQLKAQATAWRSAGEKIVFTNGCFDLLHIGHITLIENARRAGDRLVVGVNSDISVRALKGPMRPIVGVRERGRILAALAAVDAVIEFDDPTPLELIQALRPDVIVKGGDNKEETIVGAEEVQSWGGIVKIVPIVKGFSTTKLIAKAMQPQGHA